MKYLLILFIITFPQFKSNAQQIEKEKNKLLQEINANNQVANLNKFLKKNIRNKCKLNYKSDSLKIFHIYFLSYPDSLIRKEDFVMDSVMSKLTSYIIKEKKLSSKKYFPSAMSYIYDNGNLAYAIDGQVYCFYKKETLSEGLELYNFLINNHIELAFQLTSTNASAMIYFGIQKEKVYVIESSKTGYVYYSLEDFLNCCWEKLAIIIK